MLDKLFGWKKKKETPEAVVPSVSFGRYSDNNKTVQKTKRWTDADNLFKESRYHESITAFFDYLRDDAVQNVLTQSNGEEHHFRIYQGSKLVRGTYNAFTLSAEVTLARMAQPSIPVMRRLLEHNFNLYYCRYGMDGERLCMRFDTELATANPNKLYYAFKELATKADKQDDLLLLDFQTLLPGDIEHIEEIPDAEKEIKYQYLQQWIADTVALVHTLDADKMSGGISHLLLNLAYRIDFLLVPEGRLLYDIEDLITAFFTKQDRPVPEKNNAMLQAFQAIAGLSKEIVFSCFYRSKYSFAITQPTPHKTISDSVFAANQYAGVLVDSKLPEVAQQVSEYGLAYCQYNFSLPKPISSLYLVLMQVVYAGFFQDLGFSKALYNSNTGNFNVLLIEQEILQIINGWKEKYPQINFKTENLKYDSLLNFTYSFTSEVEFVNTEIK